MLIFALCWSPVTLWLAYRLYSGAAQAWPARYLAGSLFLQALTFLFGAAVGYAEAGFDYR